MKSLFTTEEIPSRFAFSRWREMIRDRVASCDVRDRNSKPFFGKMEVANIGPLLVTRTTHSLTQSEATHADVRRNGRNNRLFAIITLSGQRAVQQGGREAIARAGDLLVLDRRPNVSEHEGSFLILDLPSDRLESVLGPSRCFTTLTAGIDLASTTLATNFVQDLVRRGDQLNPDAAARMASISVDLIVASLAERMAKDVPRSLHGNITVQRAKAYIEDNIGDQTLDPSHLAGAMGTSLRRLQELFQERGQCISDYIWERRLKAAAERLADPACAHLSIGLLAYGCGFKTQAHFTRRFRDRHGMSPSDYRQAHRRDARLVGSAFGLSSELAE